MAVARRRCGFGLATSCAFLVAGAQAPAAQTDPARMLQVAAWNISHLTKEEAEELKVKPPPTRRKWRNTFGAERRTRAKRNRHGINADIIALQGLKQLSEVRGVFPATTHRIILSRAAVSELQGVIPGSREGSGGGFTAIAIRSRAGIRVSGQHFFTAPDLGSSVARRTAPIIALRLTVDGGAIWVLSMEFRSDCGRTASDGNPDCDGQRLMSDTVARWVERTRAAGIPIVAAGSLDQLKGRFDGEQTTGTAQNSTTSCAATMPDIVLIPGSDNGIASELDLTQRSSPEKQPCVSRADIGPIGRRPLQ